MTMKPEGQPTSGKKRRNRAKPSAIAVRNLIRMPLGELTRAAQLLVEEDRETAEFFLEKLEQELDPEGHEHDLPGKEA